MSRVTTTAIVVDLRRPELTRRALGSLRAQAWRPDEIVLVENAAVEPPPDFGEAEGEVPLRRIRWPDNRGFAAAVNAAAARSSGQYLLLLNNDAVAYMGWAAALIAEAEAHPRAAAVSSLVVDESGRVDNTGHLLFADGLNVCRDRGAVRGASASEAGEILGASFAACLIRREAFEALGGLDAAYFAYAEDFDFSLRARAAGWSIRYTPQAVVRHALSSTLGASPRKAFLVERNRLLLALKLWPAALLPALPALTAWRYLHHLAPRQDGGGQLDALKQRPAAIAGAVAAARLSALRHAAGFLARRQPVPLGTMLRLLREYGISARDIAP